MYNIIEKISRKASNPFRLRFKNRISAARVLAYVLKNKIGKDVSNVIILGVPRAGMITADVVARNLGVSNFDMIIPIKLTLPHDKENAIGAIMGDGTIYLDNQRLAKLRLPDGFLEVEKNKGLEEIRRRSKLYSHCESRLSERFALDGKTVILVDDGASTGGTLTVAARWLRMNEEKYSYQMKHLILALPIAPAWTVKSLREKCDAQVEVVLSPPKFYSVQSYHDEFQPVTDDSVLKILLDRGLISQ